MFLITQIWEKEDNEDKRKCPEYFISGKDRLQLQLSALIQ